MTIRQPGTRNGFRATDAVTGTMLFCCWIIFVVVSLATVAWLAPPDVGLVLVPLASALLIAVGFFLAIARRQHGAAPVFHVGTFYAAVVLIYTVYPLAVYLSNGRTYHQLSDYRLFEAQPRPEQVATIAWWHVFYFASFCLVYFLSTRHVGQLRVERPNRVGSLFFVTIAIYAGVQLYLLIVTSFFGASGATYQDTYLALRHLPLIVQQVTGRLQSWLPVLRIVLLVVLFTDYRKNRVYILLLLLWVGASTLLRMHARTDLFVLLAAVAFLRHHIVRPMRVASVVFGGAALLTLFSVLGALRNISDTDVDLQAMMTGASEFEVIFGNAYDLSFIRQETGFFLEEPALYFADFVSVIPSQLLPFTKQTASSWYMNRYYPLVAQRGGGHAFGAISESVVGFGVIEIVLRAIVLALLFAWIDRRFTARTVSVWAAAFYVWLAVTAYMSFRSTTFTLITLTLQVFIAPVLLLQVSLALWIRFSTRTGARATVSVPKSGAEHVTVRMV